MMRRLAAALALVLVAAPGGADLVVLTNGDRITGKVVGSVTRRVRVQTAYGVLVNASRTALTLAFELVEAEDVRFRLERLETLKDARPYDQ